MKTERISQGKPLGCIKRYCYLIWSKNFHLLRCYCPILLKDSRKQYTIFSVLYFMRDTVVVEYCFCDIQSQSAASAIPITGIYLPDKKVQKSVSNLPPAI